MESELGKFLR